MIKKNMLSLFNIMVVLNGGEIYIPDNEYLKIIKTEGGFLTDKGFNLYVDGGIYITKNDIIKDGVRFTFFGKDDIFVSIIDKKKFDNWIIKTQVDYDYGIPPYDVIIKDFYDTFNINI